MSAFGRPMTGRRPRTDDARPRPPENERYPSGGARRACRPPAPRARSAPPSAATSPSPSRGEKKERYDRSDTRYGTTSRVTVTGHCSSAVCTRSRWGARNPFVLMSATTPPKCHRPVPRHPSHEPKGAKPHRSKLVSCRSKPSSSMAGSHGSVPHQGLYTQSQARGTRTCVGHVTALMP
jgi:hypothetical protein